MQRVRTIVDYDPSNGEIFDPVSGSSTGGYWMGLSPMTEQSTPDVERLAKLKAAGFTAAEIVEMSKAGLL